MPLHKEDDPLLICIVSSSRVNALVLDLCFILPAWDNNSQQVSALCSVNAYEDHSLCLCDALVLLCLVLPARSDDACDCMHYSRHLLHVQ